MGALDFTASAGNGESGAPAFFSGNIASLSRALSSVAEVRVTEEQRATATVQTVIYRIPR